MPHTMVIDDKAYFTHEWVMWVASHAQLDGSRDDLVLAQERGMQAHRTFYGQLVTPGLRRGVRQALEREWPQLVQHYTMMKADDPKLLRLHFNEQEMRATVGLGLKLEFWDNLDYLIPASTKLLYGKLVKGVDTGGPYFWTLSAGVCVLKEALRLELEAEASPLPDQNEV